MATHKLPALPFADDALEPHISRETIQYHYGRHHAGYPMTVNKQPLLVCDVWEHAYYIDHRNARGDYLDAFWKLINWSFVQENWTEQTDRLSATG